jgi:excisionase family DNA binding protein
MSGEAMTQQTYLPEQTEELGVVLRFLAAHEGNRGEVVTPRYLLVGVDENDRVEVPAAVHRVLRQVVEALRAGKAVTVAPQNMTLTTQQAADLLGVSRPTVVRLIDNAELPAERTGTRRRLLLQDVLAYREQRRQRQYEALTATSGDLDEDDPAAALEQIRQVRKQLAASRGLLVR